MLWVQVEFSKLCTLGSLDVVPGESSTLTLFLRVMDTYDDDDDDDESINQSLGNVLLSDLCINTECLVHVARLS